MEISDFVIGGLKAFYNELSPELSKKLLNNTWQQLLLNSTTTLPPKPDAKNSDQSDLVKQSEFAAATFFCLAVKHNWDENRIRDLLSEHNCHQMLIQAVLDGLLRNRHHLVQKAKLFGHSIPHISDISWQMTCSLDAPGQLLYKINLEKLSNAGVKQSLVQFTCNPEELQSLVGRLKEIERHLIHTRM